MTVEVDELCHSFPMGADRVRVLDRLSLKVPDSSSVAIAGPSGSGKSTLLHIIAGLLTPASGHVRINETLLSSLGDRERSRFRNRTIGFVFQSFCLQPDLTALRNVELPLVFSGVAPRERRDRAREALASVGVAERERHLPSQLSGGEMQRVAIARAVVTRPTVLLADEPTGSLDRTTGDRVVEALLQVRRQHNSILIFVTHNERVAARMDRVLRLEEGKVIDARA